MAKSTTQVSVAQMVDLALNSPEVGAVNFNILHSLLHVIVFHLDLAECNVEFRDQDSERLQNYIATTKPGPKLTLTEYTVGPGGKGPRKRKKRRVSIEEKGKADETQTEKKKSDSLVNGSNGSLQTIVVVEPIASDAAQVPQYTVSITKENITKMQTDVEKLQQQIIELTELPANLGLIDAIRANKSDKNSPVLDMFQILNLVKRVDAAEAGMAKVASMIEELVTTGIPHAASAQEGEDGVPTTDSKLSGRPQLEKLAERVTELERVLSEGGVLKKPEDTGEEGPKRSVTGSPRPSGSSPRPSGGSPRLSGGVQRLDLTKLSTIDALLALQKQIDEIQDSLNCELKNTMKQVEEMQGLFQTENANNLPPEVRINQVEMKFNDCLEQMNSLDTMFNEQINLLQNRLGDMEKEFGGVLEKVHLSLPGGDAVAAGEQNVVELYNKLVTLQDEMNTVTETAARLWQDREMRQSAMDVMTEQIELLKIVKASKEDLEEALADKADACMINRKVSYSQFDTACDDLSKGIEEALAKLTQQEALWTQALEDIQREIGSKLDRIELTPLRDFINTKLKGLQEKFKALTTLKKEHEAAGTRNKYLRDVNCISCDKDVVMRKDMDPSMYPKTKALQPTRNMGPYLAYELDQLRKQQKCLPNSRNMNMLESALQNKMAKGDGHVCNRYCGGSHTVTTPQQRVTRLGHFLEQWGPEIAPVQDVNVKGTDGHMYKGADDANLKQTPSVKISETIDKGSEKTDGSSKIDLETPKRASGVETLETQTAPAPDEPAKSLTGVVRTSIQKTSTGSLKRSPKTSKSSIKKYKKDSGTVVAEEVQPKTSPTEVQPRTSPTEVQPKTSPTEVQPKSSPTEARRKTSPTEVPAKSSPTEVRRKTSPTEGKPKTSLKPKTSVVEEQAPRTSATEAVPKSSPTEIQAEEAPKGSITEPPPAEAPVEAPAPEPEPVPEAVPEAEEAAA